MNQVTPPPPPPPPSLPLKIKQPAELKNTRTEKEELDSALDRLLGEKYCKIFYKINTYLKPQLQKGPQCGLVALSIASSMKKNSVTVDNIFEQAVSQGFTKQGEIFDVNFLSFLAEKCCGFKTKILKGGLNSHLNCIINELLKKNLLLVPYDADFNHFPCCKNGFKAHWAVITGFVIVQSSVKTSVEEKSKEIIIINSGSPLLCTCTQTDNNDLNLKINEGKLLISKNSSQNIEGHEREGKIYLIGLQGKSKHLGLWPFDDMAQSNDNLLHFSTNRDSECFVVPEGGPAIGLRGKAIILSKLS